MSAPAGRYVAAGYEAEGFIHLSTREQVVRVANARFAGAPDLVLLCVAVERLRSPLRYEPGEAGSGELFPHLYGALATGAVVDVLPLVEGPDGFALPSEPGSGLRRRGRPARPPGSGGWRPG